jgi:hypothetical protein
MSATSRRAARREEQAAAALGGKRVHRRRGERAPDVAPIALPNGGRLGVEVKSRRRLPRLVVGALEQSRGYFGARAIPVAVLFEFGQRGGIACLPLDAFARLVGLDVAALPTPRPLRRAHAPEQLALPGVSP